MKATYRFYVQLTDGYTVNVEADNEDEAWQKIDDMSAAEIKAQEEPDDETRIYDGDIQMFDKEGNL